MITHEITMGDVEDWAGGMVSAWINMHPTGQLSVYPKEEISIYAIPRGGYVPAMALIMAFRESSIPAYLVDDPEAATVAVDDIVDSGATKRAFLEKHPGVEFVAMIRKDLGEFPDAWIVFPWEKSDTKTDTVEDNVRRLIQFIGEDTSREGLLETPARVAKAYKEWFSGYDHNPLDVMKTFEDGASKTDEMVLIGPIKFYSHCEHHMAPFFGDVTIAYIPDGRIMGLSKFPRLVEIFARRLQVQERLTTQIADAIFAGLKPKGVAVLIKARHLCVESRGIRSPNSWTTTSKLLGCMVAPEVRTEFLNLAR